MAKRTHFKIAVATAGFKGTLSATEAAQAICTGFKRASKIFLPIPIPVADGGSGTVDAVLAARGGRKIRARVADPLGRPITAKYAILNDGKTAVIEMSAASGMSLLKKSELNPMRAATFGTGQLILSALNHGARKIIVGIGDSATVDGGAGMATALGARLLDGRGRPIPPGGGGLAKLHAVDAGGIDPRIKKTKILVAADVNNPLLGKNGAARVFAPQKGATPSQVKKLEGNLVRFARIIRRDLGVDVRRMKHTGAAGGLGAGLCTFLGAELRSGGEIIAELTGLRKLLRGCSLVITGEGRVDYQTASGKAPACVAKTARELHIPVFAFCGTVGDGWEKLHRLGVSAVFAASDGEKKTVPTKKTASRRLVSLAERVGRLLIECAEPCRR